MPMQQQQYYQQAGSQSGRSTPGGGLDMPLVDATVRGHLPADEAIAKDIRSIIMSSDLATITKKTIRSQLEEKYQTSISSKKAFINETIDQVLADV
jgi:chitin synthase